MTIETCVQPGTGRQERLLHVFICGLVLTLPFEIRSPSLFSNLQWIFVGVTLAAMPIILREHKRLFRERLVIAALVFVAIQWIAAMMAPEFTANAVKGAIRTTAGFVLLCATLCSPGLPRLMLLWAISAIAAAAYGIVDYAGFGATYLFRETDFYVGTTLRLSGSFEYPTTAGAFFAIALPIIQTAIKANWLRLMALALVWSALVLTFSRGAVAAVLLVFLIWAAAGRSSVALKSLLLCGGVLAVLLTVEPSFLQRFRPALPVVALSAIVEPEFNVLHRPPGHTSPLTVRIRNNGTEVLSPDKDRPFTMAYRWYDAQSRQFVPQALRHTPIPGPLRPGESATITVSVVTPADSRFYLMTLDIFSGPLTGWFSGRGIYPGLVEVNVQPDIEGSSGNGDLSRWLERDTSQLFVAHVGSRVELWTAALSITREHPFLGVGPDNFRLLYGKYLGLDHWDTRIRSNSMYLELLTGSGLLGLAAFCFMLAKLRWRTSASSVALGIFLAHGLVDVFLMTTPIYFAFWMLLGQCQRSETPHV